jgi:hypothetical protein
MKARMGTKETRRVVPLYEALSAMESASAMMKTRGQTFRASQAKD